MPQTINHYTLDELANENKKIIIRTQNDLEITIERTPQGTRIYLPFGGEIVKRTFDYLITPKS